LYREVRGVAPDLLVYFGDLFWRSVGSIGSGNIYTFENDTGPDGSNHDWHGIFLLNRNGCREARLTPWPTSGLTVYDIAPLVLRVFDRELPASRPE
jgi:predicted AlkP superfamily phosphohydrolase/phosphomutase